MENQAPPLILGATLANTIGTLEIGVAISLFLFGVASLQVYYYNEHYENDRFEIKAAVVFIWLLELAHTILIVDSQYNFTATSKSYGTYSFIRDFPVSAKVSFICSGVLAMIFSTYCAYRIKLITKRWEFPLLCFAAALARLGAIVAVVVLLIKTDVITVLKNHKVVAVAALTLGFTLDGIVSFVLTVLLIKFPGNFQRGERSIKRLVLFSIESGFVSFLLGIPMVITITGNTYNFIWIALVFITAKVNSNSILVTLNSRHVLANSYAIPSNSRQGFRNQFAFGYRPKGDSVGIARTQVTATNVSVDDTQSIGKGNDLESNVGLKYPPS